MFQLLYPAAAENPNQYRELMTKHDSMFYREGILEALSNGRFILCTLNNAFNFTLKF
jgi:hypothetical protein